MSCARRGAPITTLSTGDIDAKVARTAARPIPAGEVSVKGAAILTVVLCLVGLGVLLPLGGAAIATALAAILLVAAYPFMKRITYWPQAWLGLTFNWGVLVGFAAEAGALAPATFVLYAGTIAWTLGYDTVYACQDKEDDLLVGVKSTALFFGENARVWVAGFYGFFALAFAAAAFAAGLGGWSALAAAPLGAHLYAQIARFKHNDVTGALRLFKSNRDAGFLALAGLIAAALLSHTIS